MSAVLLHNVIGRLHPSESINPWASNSKVFLFQIAFHAASSFHHQKLCALDFHHRYSHERYYLDIPELKEEALARQMKGLDHKRQSYIKGRCCKVTFSSLEKYIREGYAVTFVKDKDQTRDPTQREEHEVKYRFEGETRWFSVVMVRGF